MQNFPHHYAVSAGGGADGEIELTTDGAPRLASAAPAEFDGPGDRWSPETLLVGAVGNCFILTFRAIARASKLPWTSLHCDVTGTLDRVDRVTRFTAFDIHAHLAVPPGTDRALAGRVLEKAEAGCLVSRSLTAATHLVADVEIEEQAGESHVRQHIVGVVQG